MASDDEPDPTRPAPPNPETNIIRRHPTGEIPTGPDPQTTIIRRHPTGAIPTADPSTQATNLIPTQLSNQAEPQTGYIPRARPVAVAPTQPPPASPKTAIATAVLSILTGWATAVIATDLITGWWRSDRLFCVAVGFLTGISAAALIAGLIGLLLRRWVSRLLIMVGSAVAVLIFSSLFVAGAKLPAVVYAIPLLPLSSIVLAALPATGRWERSG
ncbi:hypothetical protein QGN32_16605 [Mycolicibacterium sp. ND9-15]|uniref:hypothetical protein n=1 Tax=Mycolicibacterium sp. ND9-15 TaxID=3042320 RepID=UPI002DDA0124|nr:hypothetical protein [Mycolicibacterium sp. ND9-15]WSE55065.1 hypothetical protein QGN32_16605 [Mycolicibacterium sp. ND9-15]